LLLIRLKEKEFVTEKKKKTVFTLLSTLAKTYFHGSRESRFFFFFFSKGRQKQKTCLTFCSILVATLSVPSCFFVALSQKRKRRRKEKKNQKYKKKN
jgi:hypothetical protein